MTPDQIDRVFGRGRLKMVTGDHVEVFREAAAPGNRRRYTKRFLDTRDGDFGQWTQREWRILARLIGHGIDCVPEVVQFDRGAQGGPQLVQTYDAGATVDQWATMLPVERDGCVLRHVFEDCAHWWALAHHCLRAVSAIHELSVVHLDIKGDNVCIPVWPPTFDPMAPDPRLAPRFDALALIDFAFSLISREQLAMALPIGWQTEYDYQSPRLLQALEAGRRGDLQPTRELDWRCDAYSLAAMLRRYLPPEDRMWQMDGACGWTPDRAAGAKNLILALREAHDGDETQTRPYPAFMAMTSARLAEPGMAESLAAGWRLARDAVVTPVVASPVTPLTRLAPSLRVMVSPRAPAQRVVVDVPPAVVRRRASVPVPAPSPRSRRAMVAAAIVALTTVGVAAMVAPALLSRIEWPGENVPSPVAQEAPAKSEGWPPPGPESPSSSAAEPLPPAAAASVAAAPIAAAPNAAKPVAAVPIAAKPVAGAPAAAAPIAAATVAATPVTAAPATATPATAAPATAAPAVAAPATAAPSVVAAAPRTAPRAVAPLARPPPVNGTKSSPRPATRTASQQPPSRVRFHQEAPAPAMVALAVHEAAAPAAVAAPAIAEAPARPSAEPPARPSAEPAEKQAAPAPARAAAPRIAMPEVRGLLTMLFDLGRHDRSRAPIEERVMTGNAQRASPATPAPAVAAPPPLDVAPARVAPAGPSIAAPAASRPLALAAPSTAAPAVPPPLPPAAPSTAAPAVPQPLALAAPSTAAPASVASPPVAMVREPAPRATPPGTDPDLAVQARRMLAESIPYSARRAQGELARVMSIAANASLPGQDRAVVDAVRQSWANYQVVTSAASITPSVARKLGEDARHAYLVERDPPRAFDLQLRAFGANPRDPELAGNLAFLLLKVQPGQAESARELAVHAIALAASQRTGRSDDWTTLGVASALTGRDADAVNALYVAVALSRNLEASCKAAVSALDAHGERVAGAVAAMMARIRAQGRDRESAACAMPPRFSSARAAW